jgi:hypothetical protein
MSGLMGGCHQGGLGVRGLNILCHLVVAGVFAF